jgi:hypothetical protein
LRRAADESWMLRGIRPQARNEVRELPAYSNSLFGAASIRGMTILIFLK